MHYDHIAGLSELRQILLVGKVDPKKKITLIVPTHLKENLENKAAFNGLLADTFISSYFQLKRILNILEIKTKKNLFLTK